MGSASGTDLAGFEAQLAATKLFDKPADAVAFTASPSLPKTMDLVRNFLFEKGLLGNGAPSADVDRHRDARWRGTGRHRQREAALHRDLHEGSRRRFALTAMAARLAAPSPLHQRSILHALDQHEAEPGRSSP